MLAEERQRRQENLIDKINLLSQRLIKENEIRGKVLEFKDIYASEFRHSYSEFFPMLINLQEENKESLEYLATNLETLRQFVETDYKAGPNEFEDMHKHFDKLCDHINLEISRINYNIGKQELMDATSERMEIANKDMNESTIKLNLATQKADTIQTELVTVLSIFAAIVIAFSGGFNVVGSALHGLNDAYICKLILVLLLCGFVMFNTIFLLMYLVGKLTGKSVFVECSNTRCNCNSNNPKCFGLSKIRRRLPYVFYFNVVIIVMTILDIAVWVVDRRIL